VICPRTSAQLAYCHGWYARLAEEAFGRPPDELPLADLAVVAQALGVKHAVDAVDGWEAAERFLDARRKLEAQRSTAAKPVGL